MMKLNSCRMLFDINEITQALHHIITDNSIIDAATSIDEVVIDSRQVSNNKAFIAIKGDNNDGNLYAATALKNGCSLVILDNQTIFQELKNHQLHNVILVQNSFEALYEIAKYQRSQTRAKIIALTGSVGKTTIKDMLRSVFDNIGSAHATTSNLNNHYGLPLTMCNIKKDHDFAILEMGMNHAGEIKPLSELAKPDVAIISKIAMAHIGNFKNEEEIALAKSEIFSGLSSASIAILNRDDKFFNFLKNKATEHSVTKSNITGFGFNDNSDYKIQNIKTKSANYSEVMLQTPDRVINYGITCSNQTAIFNSTIVATCVDILTPNNLGALDTFNSYQVTSGRGNIITTDNFTIIDDSYNANLDSCKAGIEYLSNLKQQINARRSVAFLGDMLELGDFAISSHQELLQFCLDKNIDQIITVGDNFKKAAENLCIDIRNYVKSTDIEQDISDIVQSQDLALIKGSRGLKMEEIIAILKNIK